MARFSDTRDKKRVEALFIPEQDGQCNLPEVVLHYYGQLTGFIPGARVILKTRQLAEDVIAVNKTVQPVIFAKAFESVAGGIFQGVEKRMFVEELQLCGNMQG